MILLKKEIMGLNQNTENFEKGQFYLIGHAHADLAWLWPVSETMHEVCPLTFRSVLNLMEQYDDFVFAQSSAQIYKWMELYYPEIFQQIKQKVVDGRWEILGGSWVEHTANILSGESLIRQYLYGKRYFKEKFDLDVKIAWLPDTFGFNWNLPQIYQKCGVDYFITHKLKWQTERNNPPVPFPHHFFWWEGPDGSRVLAFHDYGAYSESVEPEKLLENLKQLNEEHGMEKLLVVFGKGDHGGGPLPDMLERATNLANDEKFPAINFSKAVDYFEMIKNEPESADIPVFNDELYLKTHRGTLTTDSQVKRDNRLCENLLANVEKYAFLAQQPGFDYPQKIIQELWEKLLYGQVHDNLDGTSLQTVYLDAATDYAQLKKNAGKLLDAALKIISGKLDTNGDGQAIVVFNPHPWVRSDIVEIDYEKIRGNSFVKITGPDGELIPCQVIENGISKKVIFPAENIPGLGAKVFHLTYTPEKPEFPSALKIEGYCLSNRFIQVEIDKQTGNISSLKKNGIDKNYFTPDAAGNELEIWGDVPPDPPNGEPAWNIYLAENCEKPQVLKITVLENGPVRAVIRIKKSFNQSSFEQDVILYAHAERVDFLLRVNWHERYRFAKVAFPFQLESCCAAYEIPFGFIERFDHSIKEGVDLKLNHPPREWSSADGTKFEVSALRWVNVSDATSDFGITLLNDSKYGFSYKNKTLRMSLIRGPRRGYAETPEAWSDQSDHPIVGTHIVKYALVPHQGKWQDTAVARQGAEFNAPLLAAPEPAHPGESSDSLFQLKVEPNNIVIETIKKAEDSEDMIIRLYEAHGMDTQAILTSNKTLASVIETDMLEWDKYVDAEVFHVDGKKVAIALQEHEVKTIRVKSREVEMMSNY